MSKTAVKYMIKSGRTARSLNILLSEWIDYVRCHHRVLSQEKEDLIIQGYEDKAAELALEMS